MYILLSNDDGYLSTGINAVAQELNQMASDVVIVAPDRDCSGASHSLTLSRPLNITHHRENIYSVDGTPADCTHIALNGYFSTQPNLVVSGINHGANLGTDVFYSGTVGAAAEAYFLGIPAMAVSLVGGASEHFLDAAKILRVIIEKYRQQTFSMPFFLNINIPDLPYDKIRGFKTTSLGRRQRADTLVKANNPRNNSQVWIGKMGVMEGHHDRHSSDYFAIDEGFVSITPLKFDLSNDERCTEINQWVQGF